MRVSAAYRPRQIFGKHDGTIGEEDAEHESSSPVVVSALQGSTYRPPSGSSASSSGIASSGCSGERGDTQTLPPTPG
jgi:hypothetical protein